jgi:hypothetical protein
VDQNDRFTTAVVFVVEIDIGGVFLTNSNVGPCDSPFLCEFRVELSVKHFLQTLVSACSEAPSDHNHRGINILPAWNKEFVPVASFKVFENIANLGKSYDI